MRRRNKSLLTAGYLDKRISYCESVKRKADEMLLKWAYTDGTVYYLDRSQEEAEDSKRRSLGTHVSRRSDNRDAMYQECIGPSACSKGQGTPCKVWGFLACGVLHIHVLEEGESMDADLYTELVDEKFDEWRGYCEYLVCDFERCLRTVAAKHALQKAGLKLVDNYPKSSQDFNAIENVWGLLKERLNATQPRTLEYRDAFINRLHAAVRWANTHRAGQLKRWSTNQKERAQACLKTKPPGGRTIW